MNNKILLSTAYLPPIQYVAKFLQYEEIWIEKHESFIKQSYRNRTVILTANGPESLVVPIAKSDSRSIKDIRISYDTNWQHIHWNAIVSAYSSSPFFEILDDDFKRFFHEKTKYLIDFNNSLLHVVFDILEITPNLHYTEQFENVSGNYSNFREIIHPKPQKSLTDESFIPCPYTQVFDERFGFIPNLSILDILFNCGSESYEILLKGNIG